MVTQTNITFQDAEIDKLGDLKVGDTFIYNNRLGPTVLYLKLKHDTTGKSVIYNFSTSEIREVDNFIDVCRKLVDVVYRDPRAESQSLVFIPKEGV